jgi:hypothetical protein
MTKLQVHFKCDEKEKKSLEEKAKAAGLDLSEYLKRRGLDDQSQSTPTPEPKNELQVTQKQEVEKIMFDILKLKKEDLQQTIKLKKEKTDSVRASVALKAAKLEQIEYEKRKIEHTAAYYERHYPTKWIWVTPREPQDVSDSVPQEAKPAGASKREPRSLKEFFVFDNNGIMNCSNPNCTFRTVDCDEAKRHALTHYPNAVIEI